MRNLFLVNGFVSAAMMLLNRTIATSFPFPIITVAIQNIIALGGTLALHRVDPSSFRSFKTEHLIKLIPGTLLFAGALVFAMMSARLTSIPVASVCSNLRPLTTAVMDMFIAENRVTRPRLVGLCLVALGSVITAKSVDHVEFRGMQIAFVYVILTSLQSILDNQTMKSVKSQQTAVGINFYRLVLSTPLLIVLGLNLEGDTSVTQISRFSLLCLVASGIFCLCAGIVVFRLQAITSATSIQVANIAFKLVTTAVSIVIHGEVPTMLGWTGYVISMAGVLSYTIC
jgi:drug/metabolite transporter (DMT)-like permease